MDSKRAQMVMETSAEFATKRMIELVIKGDAGEIANDPNLMFYLREYAAAAAAQEVNFNEAIAHWPINNEDTIRHDAQRRNTELGSVGL